MLIGLIASAPMGPVGVLCVQRTLNKGRWYGFITGIGAVVSDLIYAAITAYGMSYVMDVLNNQQTRMYLQIVGSVLLLGVPEDEVLFCELIPFAQRSDVGVRILFDIPTGDLSDRDLETHLRGKSSVLEDKFRVSCISPCMPTTCLTKKSCSSGT